MTNTAILHNANGMKQSRPEIRQGYTVRVFERIKEGDKERTQIFEGLVIAVHSGASPMDTTFTVRKIVSGIGTEKVFPLHSPKIEKVEVKKVAKVRRAKLFFLRGRTGKAARLSERFTNAGEFEDDIAEEKKVAKEVVAETAPVEEVAKQEEEKPAK